MVMKNMKRLEEIIDIINKHKQELEDKFKIKEIGIFGSYVSGKIRKKSDIDILVEFKEPVGFFNFLDLEEYLKNLLETNIDLVSKKALKPHIGEYILKEVVYI